MIVGGVDEDLIVSDSEIAKVPVLSDSMYQINVDKISIHGVDIALSTSGILDTGNTLIALPYYMASKMDQALRKSGINCTLYKEANPTFMQIGCEINDKNDLPDLVVTLSGVPITIKGSSLIDHCDKSYFGMGNLNCLINIEFMKGGYEIILGKAFLMNTYTTFFTDRKEIWVAKLHSNKHLSHMKDKDAGVKIQDEKIWSSEKMKELKQKAFEMHLQALKAKTKGRKALAALAVTCL